MTLPFQVGPGRHLHFMGIGGIGMSGLAAVCREQGAVVSGCDATLNGAAVRLKANGASVTVGHDPAHLDNAPDALIFSSAVSPDQPERLAARQRGMPAISRGELLAALAAERHLIGIAGAHGKTTTAGMAAHLLIQAGWDPTVIVGGIMRSLGTNARAGTGAYLVAETDESDGSFLHLHPRVALVTNLDREHLSHYGTVDRLISAFQQFVRQIPPGGTLISCSDDPLIRLALSHPAQVRYGLRAEADVTAEEIRMSGHGSRFRAVHHGRSLGTFTLQVPGLHNVTNALGVIALGLILELPLITIRDALAAFAGTMRRFQVVRLPRDIWFVEDYAHHPAEIQATLAADPLTDRHRLAVFQPHRFSRTLSLEREFSACFGRADGVIVTDIYPAFERPIPGVSGERLAHLIQDHGHPCVRYVPKLELATFIRRIASPGDTIFFLGAGDIGALCHAVAARLRAPARAAG
jgi:UDP-N-acetylmuramate--alanine ligase